MNLSLLSILIMESHNSSLGFQISIQVIINIHGTYTQNHSILGLYNVITMAAHEQLSILK